MRNKYYKFNVKCENCDSSWEEQLPRGIPASGYFRCIHCGCKTGICNSANLFKNKGKIEEIIYSINKKGTLLINEDLKKVLIKLL